ncbi:MAG: LacI family DNA-binding transcriptional regulator [Phycisphaerae bacterium]
MASRRRKKPTKLLSGVARRVSGDGSISPESVSSGQDVGTAVRKQLPPNTGVRKPCNNISVAKDLARILGISRSTVSVVMRGESAKFKLAPRTVARVLAAAQQYNYTPNASAQNLRRQRSNTVTLIVSNFRFDWTDELFAGAVEILHAHHLTPIVTAHSSDPARQETEIMAAIRRRDAAVLYQPLIEHHDLYQRVFNANIPLILVGDYPVGTEYISHVIWHADMAARKVVEHLVAIGRTRIGYVGINLPLEMHQKRFAAYQQVLKGAGLALNPHWIYQGDPHISVHENLLSNAIPHIFAPGHAHPDAIFAMNDGIAIPLITEIERLGLHVPDDVAVAGIGDLPMSAVWGINLTTVREPVRAMGAEAARLAVSLIGKPGEAPIHRLLPAGDLMVRRSTAASPRTSPVTTP